MCAAVAVMVIVAGADCVDGLYSAACAGGDSSSVDLSGDS